MSLGAGECFYQLNQKFRVANIEYPKNIHLDCFPSNQIEPTDLLPSTKHNPFFLEMNSPGLKEEFVAIPPAICQGHCNPNYIRTEDLETSE